MIGFAAFYWIRERKLCFLTSFSTLNRYILFLVFLRNWYLLVSLCLSRLRENPISHPVFLHLWYSKYHFVHAPLYFWHIWHIFLKQDAQGNLVQELVPDFFPHSAFCRRFLMQTSIGSLRIIPFLLTPNSLKWHFLAWHKPPLIQCSTQARKPQGIYKVVNQGWLLLVWRQLLDDFPSALCICLCSSWFLALRSIQ